MKIETEELDESVVTLDPYNSDLNLVLDANRYSAQPLTQEGFAFMWAGARATHGFAKGKICFEVKIGEYLNVSHLPADEPSPHVVRVGFSVEGSTLQLGEDPLSYGYGGTGKISTNCQFKDFGGPFVSGDVILGCLNMDSDQVQIGFAKNGKFLGWAYRVNKNELKGQALFPHVLTKNVSFEVNFGQKDKPYFPLPDLVKDFSFANCIPLDRRVCGTRAPKRTEDCEMIMMCGLPGAGKSVWAAEYSVKHPEKKYNVLGTNNIIDKMKVMGLPRKRNYAGRWDVLIQMATKCLNKMFEIGSKLRRNYILDQTNVYPTAQRRKMKNFRDFQRRAVVVVPTEEEYKRRCNKRDREEGKEVPDHAVNEMKANFKLPEKGDLFDEVIFTELQGQEAERLVNLYNEDGRAAVGPPKKQFHSDSGFGNRGGFNSSPGRGGYAGRGGHENNSAGYDNNRGGPGDNNRGSFGNRGGFDGARGGRGGFDRSRGSFDGNRGGPDRGRGGRFDGGRGGSRFDGGRGGGYDGGRGGGYDGGRGGGYDVGRGGGFGGGRGGYDSGRGGGFDDGRGVGFESGREGGFESGRGGGFERGRGGRGGYEGNRAGGYDRNRGSGFDDNHGGYDSNRGEYDRNRGGYDDTPAAGYGGRRGSFDRGRGGFDRGRGGYQDSRGGYNDTRGIKRGLDNDQYDHSPSGKRSPVGYGDSSSQGNYGGYGGSNYGNNRGASNRGASRGRGDFGGSRSSSNQGGYGNSPDPYSSGGYDKGSSYSGRGQSRGTPRGGGTRGGSGHSGGSYSQGGYGSNDYNRDAANSYGGGYSDYQSDYGSQSQTSYGTASDSYSSSGYGSVQTSFKKEPGTEGSRYEGGSRLPTGSARPSGRTTTRWSAAEEPQSYTSRDTTTQDSSYSKFGTQVKTEPQSSTAPATNRYDNYSTQNSSYGSFGQTTQPTQSYGSNQSYGYQQTSAPTQSWTGTQTTAAAAVPAAPAAPADQSQWYYQQPAAAQANQYYNQYYGQPAPPY